MAFHKGLLQGGFPLPWCERHFHDSDETWIVLEGRGTGYWIDHAGVREEFELEAGDVWLIPAGYEHGSDGFAETGENSEDFRITVFMGTQAPGSHPVGHYYLEEERYVPSLQLVKTPVDRYQGAPSLQAQAFAAVREAIPAIGAAVPADALAELRRSQDPDAASALHRQLQQLGREHRDELAEFFASHREFRLLQPWFAEATG